MVKYSAPSASQTASWRVQRNVDGVGGGALGGGGLSEGGGDRLDGGLRRSRGQYHVCCAFEAHIVVLARHDDIGALGGGNVTLVLSAGAGGVIGTVTLYYKWI